MDAKAAVSLAKHKIAELFADEGIKNLGLEEIDYDENAHVWKVTIGFTRPWDEPRNGLAALAAIKAEHFRRTYKVVRISDDSLEVMSVKAMEERV